MSRREEYIRQLMDATRHLDRHRHLLDSPAVREMQRNAELLSSIQSALDSPALRMLRELSHFGRSSEAASLLANPALRDWLRTSEMQSSAIRDLTTALRPAENARREFERLSTVLNSTVYRLFHEGNERERQIIQQMLALSPTVQPVREFLERTGKHLSATYVGRLLELTLQMVEATDAGEVEERAARLEKHFRKQAITLPPGKVSVEGMLGIALTIILFLSAHHAGTQSEARLSDRIAQVERNIVASVEPLLPREEPNKRSYIVTHSAKVFLRPRPKSPVVDSLDPDERVMVEVEKGPWLYVIYFDYDEGITRSGWARKKYMKRLPPPAKPLHAPNLDRLTSKNQVEADATSGPKEKWVKFSESMRVISYSPDQDQHLTGLRELLKKGALALLESEEDGTYEILGEDRIYYVTMTPRREFAALLSSWTPDQRPVEVTLPGA